MGWCDESGHHEGYVAKVFADGEAGSSETAAGVCVYRGGDYRSDPEVRPYGAVIGWQVRCEGSRERPCDWRGPLHLIATEQDNDIDFRWMDPTEAREEELLREWRSHVAPHNAVARLADLTDQARALDLEIEQAVQLARRAGASWAQIARELRITKQGAQQRYGVTP